MNVVNRCVQEDNMSFLHSYDDLDLIAGHARYSQGSWWILDSNSWVLKFWLKANHLQTHTTTDTGFNFVPHVSCSCVYSLGLEVLEVVPEPDVVVVCCGGGGLLAGVAAAIKLSGCGGTRIYGVEPEGGKNPATDDSMSFEAA